MICALPNLQPSHEFKKEKEKRKRNNNSNPGHWSCISPSLTLQRFIVKHYCPHSSHSIKLSLLNTVHSRETPSEKSANETTDESELSLSLLLFKGSCVTTAVHWAHWFYTAEGMGTRSLGQSGGARHYFMIN